MNFHKTKQIKYLFVADCGTLRHFSGKQEG